MSTHTETTPDSIEELDFDVPCIRCGHPATYLTKAHECHEQAFCVECWDEIKALLRAWFVKGYGIIQCEKCRRVFSDIDSAIRIVGLI